MPRYFFNVADGMRERDTKGSFHKDADAAREAAIRFAGDVMSDEPEVLRPGHEFRVDLVDEEGITFLTVLTTVIDDRSQK